MVVEVTNIGDNYTCKPNLIIKQIENDTYRSLIVGLGGYRKAMGESQNSSCGTLSQNWRQQKQFMFQLKIDMYRYKQKYLQRYVCVEVSIYTYISLLCQLRAPRSTDSPVVISRLGTHSLIKKKHLPIKGTRIPQRNG